MSRLVALFLFLLVSLGSVAQDAKTTTPWDVILTVIVEFPSKAVGKPIFGMAEPSEADVEIHVGEADRDVREIIVRPLRPDVRRPTHLVLTVTAFGFKPITMNTGILEFKQGRAIAILMPRPEVDKAPIVEQTVPLERKRTSKDIREIAIFNASDKEANISSVNLVSTQSKQVNCYKEAARPVLSFKYPVAGNVMRGTLENTSSSDGFVYLTNSTLIEGCSKRTLKVSAPFNYAVPAAGRVFLRIELPDSPSSDLLRTMRMRQGLDQSKTDLGMDQSRMHPGFGQQRWSVWSGWTMEFEINGSLLIR